MALTRPIGISRKIISTATVLVLVITSVISASSPVAAATNNNSIRITDLVLTVDPASSRYVIKISGEYLNSTTTAVRDVEILLGTVDQLSTRYALNTFLENRQDANLTRTDYSARLNRVGANDRRTWQITFMADEVLTLTNGVYGLGVIAQSQDLLSTDVVAMPFFNSPPTNTLNTTLAIQLTTLNSHLVDGNLSPSDERELDRLINLITNAADLEVAWIVDPVLRQWLVELQNTDLVDKAVLLNSMLDVITGRTTPSIYSQPDLARLMASSRGDDLTNLVVRTQQISGASKIVAVPKDGATSADAIRKLGELGVKPILANTFLTGDKLTSVEANAVVGETSSIIADAGVSSCLQNSNGDAVADFRTKNCILNELTLVSIAQVKHLVLLTPLDWSPSVDSIKSIYNELGGKPWLAVSPMYSLLYDEPVVNLTAQQNFEAAAFDNALIRSGDRITTNATKLSSLFSDSSFADSFSSAKLRGFSALWPTGDLAAEFLAKNEDLLLQYQNSISIEASRNITVSNSTAELPITVVNSSDRDISAVVQLSSPITSLFTGVTSEVITVPSGKRVTVPMEVTLPGEGILNLTATLLAPNGQTTGKTKQIRISSAEYQGLARALVLGAFGLLVLLSISNIVKRQRDNSSTQKNG